MLFDDLPCDEGGCDEVSGEGERVAGVDDGEDFCEVGKLVTIPDVECDVDR